jgi:WS/DGAT/MGAT family acyltransferase
MGSSASTAGELALITKLSPADSVFFYMESPTNHQHTMAAIVLDPSTAPNGFDVQDLLDLSESLVDEAPGFRLKPVRSAAAMSVPMLAEDPNFNVRNHLHHIAVPAPGTMEQLSELMADIASRPLNHDIPLWENWVVSGLEEGKVAIISKSHHSLSDGVNGAETMAKMFDLEPDPPQPREISKATERRKAKAPSALEIMRTALQVRRESPSAVNTIGKAVRGFMRRREVDNNCEHPELLPGNTMTGPKLFFNGQISAFRSVGLGSLDLGEIKTIKKTFDVTVNDTVLAIVAIAVRRYLELHDDLPEEALSCMVPISLSLNQVGDGNETEGAANQVETMPVKYPVQIEDPVELLKTVHVNAAAAKERFTETYDNLMLSVVDTLPPSLAAPALGFVTGEFSARFPPCNLGVSNIPGPPFDLYMKGAKVVGNYPMGPIPNGVGLGITLMSHVDQLHFTVQGCREKTPDIQCLARFMEEALEELVEAARRGKAAGKTRARPKANVRRKRAAAAK